VPERTTQNCAKHPAWRSRWTPPTLLCAEGLRAGHYESCAAPIRNPGVGSAFRTAR
jgi:hypothetical protein